MRTNKECLHELIDQARILSKKESSEDIAEYLSNSGAIYFPLKVGQTAYFLVAGRGMWSSLVFNGTVVEREISEIAYDGRIIIKSSCKYNEQDWCGSLSEYYGDMVFKTKQEAEKALHDIMCPYCGAKMDGREKEE